MASGAGGSWGRTTAPGAAPTESRASTPAPQCHRDCGRR
uniref:Proline rich 29 n=1 Tax=Oryctolagus cuniculus TaxID=9986 RepID=A0A5F9C3I1_RABIT